MIGRLFLGRYEVLRLLGEGGMGKVYLARQTDMPRQVVVKVMHDHIAEDSRFRERFQRETVLMARFQHPYAVTLYDASLDDPFGPCIVMEYVKGMNLETLLARNGRLTAPRVASIIGQLCEVLQVAHDEGIIHRDLKPANLMILEPDTPKERIKVMDFGLAKLVEDSAMTVRKVTDTNIDFAVGTPGYIAPEQVRGEALDHRGDIYSVGVMMYELLSGRLPFQGATGMDVLLAHATETPMAFADLGLEGWVPPAVEELVFDCLAKNPEDRPQSARDLAERLDTAIDHAQILADSSEFPAPKKSSKGSGMSLQAEGFALPASETPVTDVSRTPGRRSDPAFAPTPPPRPSIFGRSVGGFARDRDLPALTFVMDAWMPESIAVIKLRGFVHDYGGEVVESLPGLVKVRLGKSRTASAAMGWLGLGRRTSGPIDVELKLGRGTDSNDSKLTIEVLFRPSHASLINDEEWREKCSKIFVELRAYLMGGG